MQLDVEGLIGAGRYERSDGRTTHRNGYRERELETRLGTLELKIPKLRRGSYFPGFLEPRKTAERALVAVIQEAWILGVSTRKVDDLVQAMGMSGISKSQVSKMCETGESILSSTTGSRASGRIFGSTRRILRCAGGSGRVDCGNNRHRREPRRPARDSRPWPWTVGGSNLLARLPARLAATRPGRRQVGDIGLA